MKTTDHVDENDILLVKTFLRYNMAVENPSFRQQSIVCIKKLLTRFFAHSYQLEKNNDKEKELTHKLYGDFISWFLQFIFSQLHLDAPYCQVSFSLELISLVTNFLDQQSTSSVIQYIYIVQTDKERFTSQLLECLSDTYDPNRLLVLKIFSKHVVFCSQPSVEDIQSLFEKALDDLFSPQPDISSVSAYQICYISIVCDQSTVFKGIKNVELCDIDASPCISIINILFRILKQQLETMKSGLVKASQSSPVHSVLFAIRSMFQVHEFNLKHRTVVANRAEFCDFVNNFIQVGFEIIDQVSPYVTNEAPEGQLCNVNLSDTFELLSLNCDKDTILQAHIARMILVCCWRSMKEVSLILGMFITNFGNSPTDEGLLSKDVYLAMWNMFNNIMLRSKHAGAYELASIGFLKLCSTLWLSTNESLRCLPINAVKELVSELTSVKPMENAQVTRRSAGLPFYLQSLSSTEPEVNGKSAFTFLMSSLTELCHHRLTEHDINKTVISLNVLRAFFKDAKMCEEVFPYIATGVKIALEGFGSSRWPIRNSCTLLFSALMQRIFGVKKVKMTGREFFSRYPQLYPHLVEKTELMSSSTGDGGGDELHPSVFPILLLLSHLYPSTVEGTDSLMKLDVFMSAILR